MGRRWTDEQKARQAALIRSWRPWERSTGPRTPQGKAVSSHNVLVGQERREQELAQAKHELRAAVAKVAALTKSPKADPELLQLKSLNFVTP